MRATLGSFLLGTRRAAPLRHWYQEAFGGIDTDHGGLRFGHVVLMIDERPDVLATSAEPRLSVAFSVTNLEDTAGRLAGLGARWIGPSTVTDPDGNVVQIFEGEEPCRKLIEGTLVSPDGVYRRAHSPAGGVGHPFGDLLGRT